MYDEGTEALGVDVVNDYLQSNTNFNINTKVIRRGRLLLYNTSDYYVKFTIKTNKDLLKVFEVPFPFRIIREHNSIIFSYMIDDLCRGNQSKLDIADEVEIIGNNKFFDKQLRIINMDY